MVKLLRPLRSATIAINGTRHTFPPQVEADMQVLQGLQATLFSV